MHRSNKVEDQRIHVIARILVILVVASCALGGLTSGAIGAWRIREGIASKSWLQTAGKITECRVKRESTPGSGSGDHRMADSTSYLPVVRYEYRVGERALSGERITVSDSSYSRARIADSIVRKYAVGADVTVFHDARDPSVAVLEPGVPRAAYLYLLAGILFIVVPFAVVGFGRSKRLKRTRSRIGRSVHSHAGESPKGLPEGSLIRVVSESAGELMLFVPPGRKGVESAGWIGAIALGLSIFFCAFFLPELLNDRTKPGFGEYVFVVGFVGAGLLGVVMLGWWARLKFESAVVTLGRLDVVIERRLFGLSRRSSSTYVDKPAAVEVLNHEDNGEEIMDVQILGTKPMVRFAASLSPGEKRWLIERINRFLEQSGPS